MIWRDDDVGKDTRLADLIAIDDLFQTYRIPHTVAIMAEGMDTAPELVDFIIERQMLVELHCWTHHDLRYDHHRQRTNLAQAVAMIERLFGKRPTVLYPPWNRTNADVVKAAGALGLKVSTEKLSLAQYIRAGGDVAEDTINFHHWFVPEALLLERALSIAAARQ
jgi:peptidoglycan/xylan/chitin deacetylase (PgdA/CDA1 family)